MITKGAAIALDARKFHISGADSPAPWTRTKDR